MLTYATVCSGIEAPAVAWDPLGFEQVFGAEIDPFASAVMAHHKPGIPNHGDLEKYQEWPNAEFDILAGGTPCQSFSLAGLRKGMDDPRGNLALAFIGMVDRYRPSWVLWENVPGILTSNGGRDFGAFIGGMEACGYRGAWRVLDAQRWGLAQRRKRVFALFRVGDWRGPAAVLFEPEELRRDPPEGQGPGGENPGSPDDGVEQGGVKQIVGALTDGAHNGGGLNGQDVYTGRIIPVPFDTTQLTSAHNRSNPQPGAPCHTLVADAHPPAVAFNWQNAGGYGNAKPGLGCTVNATPPQTTSQVSAVTVMEGVRRLTPLECERLQGFPDRYTRVPYRGKPTSRCPDGPRYRALGNSMAVPVVRWIGKRIKLFEEVTREA